MAINMPLVEVTYLNKAGEQVEKTVQTDARDQFAFSMIRRSTPNIPTQKDDPNLWLGIIVFTAMRREGYTEQGDTWDTFLGESLLDYQVLNTPGEVAADPLATP